MNLEHTRLLQIMIFLTFFYFFKKGLDVLIDIKFSTHKRIMKAKPFWKFLINLRRIFTFFLFLAVLFLLFFFKLNSHLITICLILLLYVVMYMLINERFIFYFIDETKENVKIVNKIYTYGAVTVDTLLFCYSIYAIFNIFSPFK